MYFFLHIFVCKNLFIKNYINYYWLLKNYCFGDREYGLSLSQKVDRKMIFTVYWKFLLFDISEIGNAVVFWVKKLMERWYLLISGKFLFWSFWRWEIRSIFEPKSCLKNDISWLIKSSFFELFGDWKYGLFLSQKVVWKMLFPD